MTQTPSPVGYPALIRGNRDFRRLWFGQIVSLLGDWFNLIASAALVAKLTGSDLAVGGLFVVRMLAPFLISPIAGVAADRFDRRRLLIFTDLSRAAIVLAFLAVRRPQDLWLLYALTALQLALGGVFFPTRNAILPDIVSRRGLGSANALSSATWSVMAALGSALGGIVAGELGLYNAFVIDSLTFLASAVFISSIAYRADKVDTAGGEGLRRAVEQYRQGLRYLSREREILLLAMQKAFAALAVGGAFNVIHVALAQQVFVIGEEGSTSLGLLFAVVGVGTGLGPIFARHFTRDREAALRRALTFSYLMTSIGIAVVAPLWSFAWVVGGSLIRAVGVGINWVFSTQLLLQLVPHDIRGRVFASEFALFTLASAIGSAGSGWLLDHTSLGISGLIWVTGALNLIFGVIWVIQERRLRDPRDD